MIQHSKVELRNHFKKLRSQLSEEFVTEESKKICQNFLQNLLPKIFSPNSNKIFSIYLAANNEVKTDILADYFFSNNIKFSYPKIIGKNLPLNFIAASSEQEFVANNIYPKILEPLSQEIISPDILVIPLLAFDSKMNRLGMGGGFFDRTIAQIKSKNSSALIVGLAYDFQRFTDNLVFEKYDQKLDFIVTSKNIFF